MFLICFGVVGVEQMKKLGMGKLALLQMMGNSRYVWTGIKIVCRDIYAGTLRRISTIINKVRLSIKNRKNCERCPGYYLIVNH